MAESPGFTGLGALSLPGFPPSPLPGQCTTFITATLQFHDGTATINNDTNFTSHVLVHNHHPYPRLPHHILSLTFLHPQQLFPDAPPHPHDGALLDTTIHGPLFLVPIAHSLSEGDLTNWNCTAAAALTHDSGVWVYSDGASGNVGTVTILLPGDHTYVLVQTSPLTTSAGAEFWGASSFDVLAPTTASSSSSRDPR